MKRCLAIAVILLLSGIAPLAANCVKQHACCKTPQKTANCCKIKSAPHDETASQAKQIVIAQDVTYVAAVIAEMPALSAPPTPAPSSPPTQRRLATLSTLLI